MSAWIECTTIELSALVTNPNGQDCDNAGCIYLVS